MEMSAEYEKKKKKHFDWNGHAWLETAMDISPNDNAFLCLCIRYSYPLAYSFRMIISMSYTQNICTKICVES